MDAVQLSQQDVEDLKNKGYSDQEIQQAIQEVEKEALEEGKSTSSQSQSSQSSNANFSKFYSKENQDMIKYQLEVNDILERAEHILKGDYISMEEGKMVWKENPHPEENTFNEHGVQLILKTLASYLNRNTLLADYGEEEIRYKVLDFGKELNNLIFKKYEEMGMDSEDKRKEYCMVVRELVDMVHSAYSRAKEGGERRSLREMINVQQNSQMQSQMPSQNPQINKRSFLNPMRYTQGKYVS